jgi:hypothetical protein
MEQIKPNKRYILAKDTDLNFNVSLKSNFNDLNEFNNSRIISLSELSVSERNESIKYRLYGNINYVSFLRNKNTELNNVNDLFNDDFLTTGFNLEDYFDLKIFRLTDSQKTFNNLGSSYTETLTAITNDSNYSLNYFGFARNVFNEKNYNFKFDTLNLNPYKLISIDKDIVYDNSVYLGFIPKDNNIEIYEKIVNKNDYINELNINSKYGYSAITFTPAQITLINQGSNFDNNDFNLYFSAKTQNLFKIYNLQITTDNINSNLRFIRNYLDIGNSDYTQKILLDITASTLSGNTIFFDKQNYQFNEIIKKEYIFTLTLIDNTFNGNSSNFQTYVNDNYALYNKTVVGTSISIDFQFKFNPFHKIELKKYDQFFDEHESGVTKNTNIEIPKNAIFYNNKYRWRDLLTYGDPDNYDNPFINNTHYIYNDIIFYLKPDLSNKNTLILLKELLLNFANKDYMFNKENLKIVAKKKKLC